MVIHIYKITAGSPQAGLQPLGHREEINSFEALEGFLPQGAYTTFRTYHQDQILRLSAHIRRLEESAALVEKHIEIDPLLVRAALRQIVQASGNDFRVRLVLDLSQCPGDLYFITLPLVTPPPQTYWEGVKILTTDKVRRHLPKAKLTTFITQAGELRRALPPEVHEAVMVSPTGQLLEGLSSNFFAVLNGVIYTAGQGVLSGTTRALVLDEIERLELLFQLDRVSLSDLPHLEEAFITSASRAILPVGQINQYPIGAQVPGEITKLLMDAFQTRVERELEHI